VCIKLCLA